MDSPVKNINFSALSKGEQSEVYRIIHKAQSGQQVTEKEYIFINDMAVRGLYSHPDAFNKAWSNLVSMVGINAGAYLWAQLEYAINKSEDLDELHNLQAMLAPLARTIEQMGGTIDKTDLLVYANKNAEVYEINP